MGLIAKKGEVLEVDFFYNKTFKEIEIDVIIKDSEGFFRAIAFWKGSNKWAVRFIPQIVGTLTLKAICSNGEEIFLEEVKVVNSNIEVLDLKLSANKEYLIQNSKPVFWLSDTWWMALCGRLSFEDFKELANIRKEQGFNTIQLVAGLFPDMDSFDKRGANRGGFVWQEGYDEINPNFFEIADKKIKYLYSLGFNIAIVGAWGYYLEKMGIEKMKKHWRYIIARWGVYSSIYIAAGEATMPFYLSKNRDSESKRLKRGWSEILEYIKKIDPFNRVLTIHPIEISLNEIEDKKLIDINLVQASHSSYESIKKGINLLQNSTSIMATIMDEINYEGILRDNHDGVIRLSFWKSILNNSKGFGYGANGIWQVNQESKPFGPSPHGAAWGDISYKRAIAFKGAEDIANSKAFLEEFEWWKLKSINNLEPKVDKNDPKSPLVATIENKIFIAYFYNPIAPWDIHYTFCNLESNKEYIYYYYSPNTYLKTKPLLITTNSSGKWQMPTPPSLDDWILVLKSNNKPTLNKTKPLYKRVINKVLSKLLFKGKS